MDTRVSLRRALLCVGLFLSGALWADDVPDLEFLEYLSDWQDADGDMLEPQWFDGEWQIPDSEPMDTRDAQVDD